MKKIAYNVLGILLLASSAISAQAVDLSDAQLKRSIARNFADRFIDDGRDIDAGRAVYFDPRSDEVDPAARPLLAKHAEYFTAHDSLMMILAGYADERGTPNFNIMLGERRAVAVQAIMVSLGVDPKHIRIISFGEDHPVVAGKSEEAKSKNRRVEILYMDNN